MKLVSSFSTDRSGHLGTFVVAIAIGVRLGDWFVSLVRKIRKGGNFSHKNFSLAKNKLASWFAHFKNTVLYDGHSKICRLIRWNKADKRLFCLASHFQIKRADVTAQLDRS